MSKTSTIIFILAVISMFFTACSVTKHLSPGQNLLKGNTITLKQQVIKLKIYEAKHLSIHDSTINIANKNKTSINPLGFQQITRNIDNRKELKNNLQGLIKQKPNTKILLFFPLNLWVYNLAFTKRDKGFYWWIRTHVGEEPVLLDTNLCFMSSNLINAYLRNKGYLKPFTHFKIYKKHQKAIVDYVVWPGTLYVYDTIRYISDNYALISMLSAAGNGSLIKRNDAFDVSILDKERDRISRFFQDRGYFRFNKNQLYYEWDTSAHNQKVNLILHLVQMADYMIQTPYIVNQIYVNASYKLTGDTSQLKSLDTILYHGIHIVSDSNIKVLKPFAINENIYLRPGNLFSVTNSDNTLKQLNGIGTFKFVTVHYDYNDSGFIKATYYLTPYKRKVFQYDFDLYNTIENPIGSGVKLSYKNRNLLHIALQFLIDITTGIEITNFKYYYSETKNDYRIGVFNISPKVSFYWPRFVTIPGLNFLQKLFPQNNYPKTILTAGYAYDERIKYFTLRSSSTAFGYEEDLSLRTHIIWNLLSISYAQASNFTPGFNQTLIDNPILARSLEFKFIQGSNFSYLHNNQRTQDQKKYYYLRLNVEYAGNLLRLISGLSYQGASIISKNYWDTTRSFSLDGNSGSLKFAQFLKVDGDIRKYIVPNKRNIFVMRLSSGIGIAYGNSSVLPYTKQFFLGGASGLRGWQVYGLGPGTYHPLIANRILYDQTGDMKLELNGEYRFSFIGRLKGALFTDAGNIWNVRRDPNRPEGQFNIHNPTIGWDAGAGLRVDFTFFIFRLDIATPLFNPTQLSSDRWISTFKPFNGMWLNNYAVFNFAIGYPF